MSDTSARYVHVYRVLLVCAGVLVPSSQVVTAIVTNMLSEKQMLTPHGPTRRSSA